MKEYKEIPVEDYEVMLDLAYYAFNVKKTESHQKKFENLCSISTSYGAFQDNALMSQMIIRPMEVYFHGRSFPMGGIAYVSSYPENRGSGDISQLMKLSLERMKKQNQVLSYLSPFSYSFYRKYGYEQCFDDRQYTIGVNELPKIQKTNGIIKRVKWKTARENLKEIYQTRYNLSVGPLKRSEWDWDSLMTTQEEPFIALYVDEKGKAQGYLVYSFSEKSKTFTLQEMVYLTYPAFKGLWNFVVSHKATFDTFTYKTDENEKIAYLFNNPRVKEEVIPSMMARIVNIEQFLTAYPFKEKAAHIFYIKVEDPFADWNSGIWKLELYASDRRISRVTDKKEEEQATVLSGTIQAWTQVFMNYRTINELYFFERIKGNKQVMEKFSEWIPEGCPVLHDFF